MKLKDLFEQQKVINDDVVLPSSATKMKYAGAIINGDYIVEGTKIKTLKGGPAEVRGKFSCNSTQIESLEGGPRIVNGSYYCAATKIKSLKGAAQHVEQEFYCHHTRITSFEGAPEYIGDTLFAEATGIVSLHNIHKQLKHVRYLHVPAAVHSHVLGVLFIKSLRGFYIQNSPAVKDLTIIQSIINKHLRGDRDIHAAHGEMLEAGLEEFAQI